MGMESSFRLVAGCEYSFRVLWEDGERVFCKGWRDGTDGGRKAVLAVLPAAEHPSTVTVNRLVHEYDLKHELDSAWAALPVELVRMQSRTMLVLEDPGGEPLNRTIGTPMEIGAFLRIAIAIAAALDGVHERGLVHKDIKPANILVDPAGSAAWLTGFDFASRLPRERQSPGPPEVIAGTLAYMAPEQTGHMNRSVDSRSDLYAYGMTLYEMLTGVLPFSAADPMEWIHCHLAREAIPPSARLERIPEPLSAIVMKLLAKTAEDRYQTAAGVAADLRHCQAEWESRGRIARFRLGRRDVPDQLRIPEVLYGREREIDRLVASFDRVVASGAAELVLVSGYSGIGKSSVVNELHRALVPARGLFASGKFDQYKRDVPYATLAQAFQSLVRPLLGQSEEELGRWRRGLLEALGQNGQLIVHLVPELELVIGKQPPVPELPPLDARNRFHLVFRRFLGTFARKEHPLALFLDDLQWLDEATLDLLEHLATHQEVRYLLLVGAYRINEVTPSHPLLRTLDTIRNGGTVVEEIRLAPLIREDLGRLVAGTLSCPKQRARPLTQLVHEKTDGNPFFAIQFLSALAEDGLLRFDRDKSRWCWELEHIHAKRYTENVVDLMVGKLARLPAKVQAALQKLACFGNVADTAIFSIVLEKSEEDLRADLWDAVRLELVELSEGSYKFIHDRVQEAAYSLIPEASRAAAHLRIGRLLAANTTAERRKDAVFDIANQLNRGAALMTSREEREQLAELNLLAGQRAKATSACASALAYLTLGAAMLPDNPWDRHHELAFALEWHRAECEFLTGELTIATERLNMLSTRAVSTVERAMVACLHIDLYTALNQPERAIAVGLAYLRYLGIDWSSRPTSEEAQREYERIWLQIGNRAIEELVHLPLMSDRASQATLDVLTAMVTPALWTDPNLLSLVVCGAVNLSLERGNSDGSCFAYVWLGVLAARNFDDYKAGFRFGQVGLDLVEKRGLKRFGARARLIFGNLIVPWTKHVRAGRDLLRAAFEAASEAGDLTFAAYSCDQLNTNLLASGEPLAETQHEVEKGLDFARKGQLGVIADVIASQLALIKTLRGLTPAFGSFGDEEFDETRFERHLVSELPECRYWIGKLQADFMAGNYPSALDASAMAQPLLWTSISTFEEAEYEFYSALAHAACCGSDPASQRSDHLEALRRHRRQLDAWAENCPENFDTRAALVGAESARVEGRDAEAMRLYEKAIRSAHDNELIQNEALADELASRFYAGRGFERIARAYMHDARHCYLHWGAAGKVRQLEQLHPYLTDGATVRSTIGTVETSVQQLDLATVIKVLHATSGDIVLEQSLETIMRAAIEQAGAERGLLVLARGPELRVAAEVTTAGNAISVDVRDRPLAADMLPETILRYVVRSRKSMVLDDAAGQAEFAGDPYIAQRRPRSLLCVPLLKQAKLVGALYLENSLSPRVFSLAQVAILELLASQAAISLENIHLYRDLRDMQLQLAHANRIATIGQLTSSIAHEVNQPITGTVTNAHTALRLLNRQVPDLEKLRLALDRILRDGMRAGAVVDRLRNLIKKAPPRRDWLDINPVIREVIELTRSEAAKIGLSVETALDADLPRLRGDRVGLQQVMLNLIINAFDAMSSEDECRELRIVSEKTGEGGVLVTVADSGPGLSSAASENLFKAFHTTKPGGLGLGLSICRSIIEAHGGRLWASGNRPRGAVFHFVLPTHLDAPVTE